MQEDSKRIQLGAILVRRLAHAELLFAGCGNTKRMFLQIINDLPVGGKIAGMRVSSCHRHIAYKSTITTEESGHGKQEYNSSCDARLYSRSSISHARKKSSHRARVANFWPWNPFVLKAFMPLAGRLRLRDGVRSMRARVKSLCHFGTEPAPCSTVSDANNLRPASFDEALYRKA